MKYELDNIYCADCYEAINDIPDRSVDLIVMDPPYQITNTQTRGKSDFSKSMQYMLDELEDGRFTESVRGGIIPAARARDESNQLVCVV